MNPREHQRKNYDIAMRLVTGEQHYRYVYNNVTTGGGKSYLPVIYASLLIPRLADKLCWIVPREPLRVQAEEAFTDAEIHQWLGCRRSIRASINDIDPSRDTNGYVTTYQAVAANPDLHRHEFDRYRYILVLDEPQHVKLDGTWHQVLQPLVDRAVLIIFMSGGFERGDGDPLAFLDYVPTPDGKATTPDTTHTEERAVVIYSRTDALGEPEPAIVRIDFEHCDLKATWINRKGNRQDIDTFDGLAAGLTGDAIFTGLSTRYAHDLLERCYRHWQGSRVVYPWAQLLVVAHSQYQARKYEQWLRDHGCHVALAVSDEGKEAHDAIIRFRRQQVECLVTVGMAYEGLNAPAITHIAALTHIRSRPWIEQMFGRGVRRYKGTGRPKDRCYVFAPDDPFMRAVIQTISDEQGPIVKEKRPGPPGPGPTPWDPVVPLVGEISGIRSEELGGESLDRNETARCDSAIDQAGLTGRISPLECFRLWRYRETAIDLEALRLKPVELTPSQEEDQLRTFIQKRATKIDRDRKQPFKTTNTEIVRRFGKSREQMTRAELRAVWAWMDREYPGIQ